MTSPENDAKQRELFARDLFAAPQAVASPSPSPSAATPPAPLFKAPTVPTRTLPVPPRGPNDAPLRQI